MYIPLQAEHEDGRHSLEGLRPLGVPFLAASLAVISILPRQLLWPGKTPQAIDLYLGITRQHHHGKKATTEEMTRAG